MLPVSGCNAVSSLNVNADKETIATTGSAELATLLLVKLTDLLHHIVVFCRCLKISSTGIITLNLQEVRILLPGLAI